MTTAAHLSHIYVVAIEYQGPDVHPTIGEARVPICEHAYDLGTARLADHVTGHGSIPRIAFPETIRGWNTRARLPRCRHCEAAVLDTVRNAVRCAFSMLATSVDDSRI